MICVRKLVYVLVVTIVLVLTFSSCEHAKNTPPDMPTNPSPADGEAGVDVNVTLTWSASDPDRDALSYDVYFGESENPSLVKEDLSEAKYTPGTLEYGTTYYWKVIAKDGKGGETVGKVWKFTTKEKEETEESTGVNYIAIAAGDGILIVDVKDPENPKVVGLLDTDGYAEGVYVSGNYAYVADGRDGLVIVDISNPENPKKVGHLDTDGYAQGVYVLDNYAYVADEWNGLVIVDISDPSSPDQVGHFDTSGWAFSVYVSGNYAYVADGDNGLVIVDINDPKNPKQVGHLDADGRAQGVYVLDNYAYVADWDNGLVIVDVSDPENPKIVKDMFWTCPLAVFGF